MAKRITLGVVQRRRRRRLVLGLLKPGLLAVIAAVVTSIISRVVVGEPVAYIDTIQVYLLILVCTTLLEISEKLSNVRAEGNR